MIAVTVVVVIAGALCFYAGYSTGDFKRRVG